MGRRGRPNVPLETRFWTKVERRTESECWPWTASTDGFGYGMIGVGSHSTKRSHVVSYELHKGPVPVGMVVRHTCDNPICVNPGHLLIGTVRDNTTDRMERGRSKGGHPHGPIKVTVADIAFIRASTETTTVLARRFGLSCTHTRRLRRGG
jgi:hypothetical protein